LQGATACSFFSRNDITDFSTTCPAVEVCGGTLHFGPLDDIHITFGEVSNFMSSINSGHWKYGDKSPDSYYSIISKLPIIVRLIAVSTFNNSSYSYIKRKGAAIVAVWPIGEYWTGHKCTTTRTETLTPYASTWPSATMGAI
jgi:hypothetical protein